MALRKNSSGFIKIVKVLHTYGKITEDFFEENPEWKYIPSSRRLLKENNKEVASAVRWCVYLLIDPTNPYFAGNGLLKRHQMVERFISEYGVLKEGDFLYDGDTDSVSSERFQYVLDSYPKETMSRKKRDYHEREKSYSLLVLEEREETDIKKRAQIQKDIAIISKGLDALYDEILKEEKTEKDPSRTRGTQQRGALFK